jgi:hypothetical protein
VQEMRQRLGRGLVLSNIEAGDLPRAHAPGLHIDPTETVHLDMPATHLKYTANGRPKQTQGRLVVSSAKLRFVAMQGGSETAWAKVVEVRREYANVVLSTSASRGGGIYQVTDAEYTAAVLSGAMKLAKRMVVRPGDRERDSRAIPQAMKIDVWQRDGGKCRQCSATEYLEFDHIIPWSMGGATSVDNLQILCRRDNLAKGARI